MVDHGLGNGGAHFQSRIKTREWILKDHLDLGPRFPCPFYAPTLKGEGSRVVLDQATDNAAQGGFSRSGFSDKAIGFIGPQLQIHGAQDLLFGSGIAVSNVFQFNHFFAGDRSQARLGFPVFSRQFFWSGKSVGIWIMGGAAFDQHAGIFGRWMVKYLGAITGFHGLPFFQHQQSITKGSDHIEIV
ncbi:MAG: Uncharacterised protein [Flavobacteriia bacterium]|nr:MAG: Uncharacterised protein [Flavobacteriia bacterium]